MRVLVTRPREDAEALLEELTARGHAGVVEPLLEVRPREDAEIDLADVQALLFTSANGVRAFARLSPRRDLPALAVGEHTAEAARAAGFGRVASAGGDVGDLARLARERLEPADGALLHAAGSVTAGDLQGRLQAAGFRVRKAQLYESRAAETLSAGTCRALAAGALGAVVFFSPRTAETFVSLVQQAGLADACLTLHAVCLSQAVAERARALRWRAVHVAERPQRQALLAALPAAADGRPAGAALTKGAMPQDTRDPERTAGGDGAAEAGGDGAAEAGGGPPAPAQDVIARFGGIRPMAHKLGIAVSTVQGWKARGVIPAARHGDVRAAAERHGIELAPELLARAGERPEAPEAPEAAAAAEERPAATAEEGPPGGPGGAARPPSPAGSGWLPGMLVGAAILAVGIAAALLTRDIWSPQPDGGATAGRLQQIEQRLAAVEQRGPVDLAPLREELAALRRAVRQLREARVPPARVEDLGQRLDELGTRLQRTGERVETLSGRLDELAAATPDAAAIDGLEERLAAVEQDLDALDELRARLAEAGEQRRQTRAAVERQTALALAVAQLRDALRFSAPFAEELQAAHRLARGDPELESALARLRPYAESGVPTREALDRGFDAAARATVAAAAGEDAEGWMGGVLRRLASVVSVRPVGDAEGEGAGAVLARAESGLAAGDLAGAVATLETLSGPPAEAMAAWLEKAQARLAAERALSVLSARLMDRLAAAGADGE